VKVPRRSILTDKWTSPRREMDSSKQLSWARVVLVLLVLLVEINNGQK
jgi:hypothetical protein